MADIRAALDGARAILMEAIAEDAHLVGELRDWLWAQGQIRAKVVAGKENEGAKFRDYFDHVEAIGKIPSHRLLALMRARNEGVIELELAPAADSEQGHAEGEGRVAAHANIRNQGRAADAWLRETVRLTWRVKLHLHLTLDLFGRVREGAEDEAIRVFGDNLKDLMLAAPAGAKTVMGLDPGIRTGCKVAVVDATGKVLATDTIYPLELRRQWNESLASLARLCKQHHVDLISIGNGTGSRETDKLAGELIKGLAKVDASHTIANCCQGIPESRRDPARCGLDRAPPAGPAGRTGEDRAEGDRRGPVPARRQPDQAGARPRCARGRLRQRGGRGCEHSVGAVIGTRVRIIK